ncbi:hypothetical protein JL2886_02057 [Phaeobacter gallaeciensis]|uniref:Uncharacterized protein n=1 Tax=Phaeobacter gallaeciensis TaxID=60890 RepID=A0A1B0ZS26_9RHOB|nr:hypothetical protein JL2886_02057 [Phaeobacter gallaeciensis]
MTQELEASDVTIPKIQNTKNPATRIDMKAPLLINKRAGQ